jgi:FMN reductase
VKSASLLIVASPTFKAAYTGLLKLFLDQFPAGELIGMTAIPLMLGAAPRHALAPELLLRPVLTEIGCSCPLPGLYLLDSQYAGSPELFRMAATGADRTAGRGRRLAGDGARRRRRPSTG